LDRRTDRPDGSGGGSPTVVTSRATADDLTGDEQDTRPSDIMAPPRRSTQQPTAARSASANAAPDALPNGSPDATAKDTPRPAAADATVADGVPAFPADTIGAPRTKAKGPDSDRDTPASKVSDPSPADDPPTLNFGPLPPSALARPGMAVADYAEPAESAVEPSGDDASPTAPVPTAPARPAPSGPGSSGMGSSGTVPSGPGPSGRPSATVPPAPADPPSVSPAAFAFEMPDPPPNSPSSSARTFLRSGTTAMGSAAAASASANTASANTASTNTASANPGTTGAGKTVAAEGAVTMRNPGQKGKKGQSKRTARQAHLTVARVEPWSVMKFSFVVSLVAFVILFVAVFVLYSVLSGLGVFDSLQRVVQSVTSSQTSSGVNAKVWFSASKVLGYTALLGSLNIVLITAMATIGSVVYNLTSRLVGGVEVTLRETE